MDSPSLLSRLRTHAHRQDGRASLFALMIVIMLAFMWPELKTQSAEVRKLDRGAKRVFREAKREYRGLDHKVSVGELLNRDGN